MSIPSDKPPESAGDDLLVAQLEKIPVAIANVGVVGFPLPIVQAIDAALKTIEEYRSVVELSLDTLLKKETKMEQMTDLRSLACWIYANGMMCGASTAAQSLQANANTIKNLEGRIADLESQLAAKTKKQTGYLTVETPRLEGGIK